VAGVDDGAAFKGLHNPHDDHDSTGANHADLGTGGDEAALVRADSKAGAATGTPHRCGIPAKLFRRRLQHRASAGIPEIFQAEGQRIDFFGVRLLVDVGFARKVVRDPARLRQEPCRNGVCAG
jgi:hypothetical protein